MGVDSTTISKQRRPKVQGRRSSLMKCEGHTLLRPRFGEVAKWRRKFAQTGHQSRGGRSVASFPPPKALAVGVPLGGRCWKWPPGHGRPPLALLRTDGKTHARAIPASIHSEPSSAPMAGLVVEQLLPDPPHESGPDRPRKGEETSKEKLRAHQFVAAWPCSRRRPVESKQRSAAAGRGPWLHRRKKGKALRDRMRWARRWDWLPWRLQPSAWGQSLHPAARRPVRSAGGRRLPAEPAAKPATELPKQPAKLFRPGSAKSAKSRLLLALQPTAGTTRPTDRFERFAAVVLCGNWSRGMATAARLAWQ